MCFKTTWSYYSNPRSLAIETANVMAQVFKFQKCLKNISKVKIITWPGMGLMASRGRRGLGKAWNALQVAAVRTGWASVISSEYGFFTVTLCLV